MGLNMFNAQHQHDKWVLNKNTSMQHTDSYFLKIRSTSIFQHYVVGGHYLSAWEGGIIWGIQNTYPLIEGLQNHPFLCWTGLQNHPLQQLQNQRLLCWKGLQNHPLLCWRGLQNHPLLVDGCRGLRRYIFRSEQNIGF